MVKELAWYIETQRFANIVDDIEKKAAAYEDALKAGGGNAGECREELRALCQWHLEKSGYKKGPESFVSVDDEFFDGTEINRAALNAFEKEIVKAHMYQKHLWEFMGTTGSMTVITKAAMRKGGLVYEDYLPKSYKEEKEAKSPAESGGENAVSVYMYADGTASTAYDGAKAKFRFDVLRDKSGFDWNRIGWDPNYQVRKEGWHGRYNDEGAWERVDTPRDAAEGAPVVETGGARLRSLELLKVGDGGILYDPGYSLLTLPEIIYLLLDDSVYGAESESASGTVGEISEAMQALGISRISAVAGINTNTAAADDGEKISRYKAVLGDMASEGLEIRTLAEYQKVKDDAVRRHQDSERQVAGRRLCAGIRRAAGGGLTGTAVLESVKSGAMRVPLDLESAEDRQLAGLSDEVYGRIKSYGVPEEKRAEFERVAVRLSAEYELIKDGGLSMETLLEEAYRTVVQGKRSEATVTLERTFGELCLSEGINYHGQRPDGYTAGMLRSEISSVPLQGSKETQRLVDRALANVEENFEAVRASTGMTPAEAVRAAVKVAGGKNIAVFVPPVSGFVPRSGSAEKDDSARRIYLDIPLSALIEDAVSADPPTKTVSLWADYRNEPDYTDEGRAYNLLDEEEREAWLDSDGLKATGLGREELMAFLSEEEERLTESLASSPEPALEVSAGKRLSLQYGTCTSGRREPEGCVLARIEPKTVSLGAAEAAAKANGAVAEAAAKTSGKAGAKRYSAAAVRMNGKLSRSIAAARTVESLAREAPAPKAKAAPEAGDGLEEARGEADETARAAGTGAHGGVSQEMSASHPIARQGAMPEVTLDVTAGVPQDGMPISADGTADGMTGGMPVTMPDISAFGTIVNSLPAMHDGMSATTAANEPYTRTAGIPDEATASVPGELTSVTAGGEPAAAQDFVPELRQDFSPDLALDSTPHTMIGGSPAVFVDGVISRRAGRMPDILSGTMPDSRSGSMPGTMPNRVSAGIPSTVTASVPGELPSVTVGCEPAAVQDFVPELRQDFSPDLALDSTPHTMIGGSPAVFVDGVISRRAGRMPDILSGRQPDTMPAGIPNAVTSSVPGELPSVTVGGEPTAAQEFTQGFNPDASQQPYTSSSGSEPAAQNVAVRQNTGASPAPDEPHGNIPQDYADGVASSNGEAETDEEKARMERMTTNYEKDREILAKEDPAFSRTTFRDVGHALSDAELEFNKKNSERGVPKDVKNIIEKVRL